jgi:2-polyprenyl-3-methyl-5-hydroxy-6-metoxy-1,4-benzoquinol methylase
MISTDRTDQLAERLFTSALGALELYSVYLGSELGLYHTLEREGALTPDELAERAGIAPRYAREWLEQQAVAGLLEHEDGRFSLPAGHARVLAHVDDPAHVAPFGHMLVGIGAVLPRVAEAYRTGGGVAYELYGYEFRHGQGHINRPAFVHELPAAWIDALPDIRARLEQGGRVADVGCGQGFSTRAMAERFPHAAVEGFDVDAASIEDARRHAQGSGAAFVTGDATTVRDRGPYDLVLVLEALHDIPHPVETLAAVRAALAPGGAALIVDERVADRFEAPGDEVERMMYGWSVTHCLPTQMVEQPSAAIGTVLRADTVRELAAEAGFASLDVLPVENDFFRLYRLG